MAKAKKPAKKVKDLKGKSKSVSKSQAASVRGGMMSSSSYKYLK